MDTSLVKKKGTTKKTESDSKKTTTKKTGSDSKKTTTKKTGLDSKKTTTKKTGSNSKKTTTKKAPSKSPAAKKAPSKSPAPKKVIPLKPSPKKSSKPELKEIPRSQLKDAGLPNDIINIIEDFTNKEIGPLKIIYTELTNIFEMVMDDFINISYINQEKIISDIMKNYLDYFGKSFRETLEKHSDAFSRIEDLEDTTKIGESFIRAILDSEGIENILFWGMFGRTANYVTIDTVKLDDDIIEKVSQLFKKLAVEEHVISNEKEFDNFLLSQL